MVYLNCFSCQKGDGDDTMHTLLLSTWAPLCQPTQTALASASALWDSYNKSLAHSQVPVQSLGKALWGAGRCCTNLLHTFHWTRLFMLHLLVWNGHDYPWEGPRLPTCRLLTVCHCTAGERASALTGFNHSPVYVAGKERCCCCPCVGATAQCICSSYLVEPHIQISVCGNAEITG